MNIRKKLLGYLAAIGLGFMVFAPSTFMGSITHAQTTDQTTANQTTAKQTETVSTEQALNEFWTIVDMALKLIYIVIWPMLFLAGIALDNSMVYGSFFHMDAPLWFFWNMTKNFANFALGFMVLFAILRGIFTSLGGDKKDNRSPMNVIKKTLIAGVLIQASWFIMAALIDVSTIATYAVGGMPMTLLNSSDIKGANTKILQTVSHLELNNINKIQQENFRVWYKTQVQGDQTIEISPCSTKTLGTDTYIIGRKYGNKEFSAQEINSKLPDEIKINKDPFKRRNVCIYGNKPYFFNEFPNTIDKFDSDYTTALNKNILEIGNQSKNLEQCMFIVNLESSNTNFDCKKGLENIKQYLAGSTNKDFQSYDTIFGTNFNLDTVDGKNYGAAAGSTRLNSTGVIASTVSSIIDKSKGFVGPFVTIYASIMDFANLSDTNGNNSSIGKNIGDLIIRTAVAIGLVFPLIALAVVLFIRIGFLRAIIAASPLIILAIVFDLKVDKLSAHISVANILKAIFAPVITVFALSISMIFMTTLSNSLSRDNIDKINVVKQLGGDIKDEGENTNLTIAGFTIVYPKIVDTYAGATGDRFSWMLISFCGIGIMWFILFAAIKASGTIGKVAESIQNFGENVFKTTPIIPIGGGVGFGTLGETLNMKTATTMRDNKVDLKGQKESMQTYFEDRFSMAKENYGEDRDFSVSEKATMQSLFQKENNSKEIQDFLVERGFAKGNTPEDMQQVYNNNTEFKEMINANTTLGNQLLGETFMTGKQSDIAKTKISNILNKTYADESALKKALDDINNGNQQDITKVKDCEKTRKIGEQEFKITKDNNNKLISNPIKK